MTDEHRGEGGSYLLDPETGERTLIKRTLPPTPSEVTTNGSATAETPDLDRDGGDVRNGSDSDRRRRRTGSRSEHHSPAE